MGPDEAGFSDTKISDSTEIFTLRVTLSAKSPSEHFVSRLDSAIKACLMRAR